MKKSIYILSALLALAACAREEMPVRDADDASVFTFRAVGEGQGTKTVLQEDGAIFWENGDAIKIYDGSYPKFTTTLSAPSQTAVFTGTLDQTFYTSDFEYDMWALYPYEAGGEKGWCSLPGNEGTAHYIETAVPYIQTAREGSFDRTAFLSMANAIVDVRQSMGTLTFYNICGGVKFSIKEEGVEKVTFFANAGEPIAGEFRASFDAEGKPYVFIPPSSVTLSELTQYSRIELRAPEGETFQKGKWYCIAAIPTTLEQGFTLRFTKQVNGQEVTAGEYVHRDPVTIKRAVWGKVGDADEGNIYSAELADNTVIYSTNNGKPASTKSEASGFDENGDPVSDGFYTQEGILSHTYDSVNDCYVLVFDDKGTGEMPPYFNSCENVVSVRLPGNLDAIGERAFYDCAALKTMEFSPRINRLGDGAFMYCDALEEVVLPANAMTFGKYVFSGCSKLTSINIPAGTKQIGDNMFSNCRALKNLTLPDSVELIGEYAFSDTGFTSFVIPDSVTAVWRGVFYGCQSLEEVTWSKGYEYVSSYAFYGCNKLTTVHLHDDIVSIGDYAFYRCDKLSSIEWPKNLQYIDKYVFCYGGIEEAILPKGLQGIGDEAFREARSLRKLVIPSTITRINTFNLFRNCTALEDVTLPSTLTEITSSGVFAGCTSLKHIDLPEEISVLGFWTFEGCGLESFTIPKNINVVVEALLSGCENLTEVTLHDGVTLIQSYAFNGCSSLGQIDIPASVTEIRSGAFSGTALEEITIPEGVKSIGESCFANCRKLTSVHLPSTLESFGTYAFSWCDKMEEITIPAGVTDMGYGTFADCQKLTKVNIPSGVTEIKGRLFTECSSLEEITLPAGLTTIGYSAFYKTGLKEVDIPSGVTIIEAEAFYHSTVEKFILRPATPPALNSHSLPYRTNFEIRVPEGSVDAYKAADGWSNYADLISAIE